MEDQRRVFFDTGERLTIEQAGHCKLRITVGENQVELTFEQAHTIIGALTQALAAQSRQDPL